MTALMDLPRPRGHSWGGDEGGGVGGSGELGGEVRYEEAGEFGGGSSSVRSGLSEVSSNTLFPVNEEGWRWFVLRLTLMFGDLCSLSS